jgi:hypothetical protein
VLLQGVFHAVRIFGNDMSFGLMYLEIY